MTPVSSIQFHASNQSGTVIDGDTIDNFTITINSLPLHRALVTLTPYIDVSLNLLSAEEANITIRSFMPKEMYERFNKFKADEHIYSCDVYEVRDHNFQPSYLVLSTTEKGVQTCVWLDEIIYTLRYTLIEENLSELQTLLNAGS